MPWHSWGDQWFQENGKDLNKAMRGVMRFVNYTTGGYLSCKEKYGTARWEHLFKPDIIPYDSFLNTLWCLWSRLCFRCALAIAVLRFPHIRDELLEDSPFHEDEYWR